MTTGEAPPDSHVPPHVGTGRRGQQRGLSWRQPRGPRAQPGCSHQRGGQPRQPQRQRGSQSSGPGIDLFFHVLYYKYLSSACSGPSVQRHEGDQLPAAARGRGLLERECAGSPCPALLTLKSQGRLKPELHAVRGARAAMLSRPLGAAPAASQVTRGPPTRAHTKD